MQNIFSAAVGPHLASLLKNVTHASQVLTERSSRFWKRLFSRQPLNGCFRVETQDKKSIQRNTYINKSSRNYRNFVKIKFRLPGYQKFHPPTDWKQVIFWGWPYIKNYTTLWKMISKKFLISFKPPQFDIYLVKKKVWYSCVPGVIYPGIIYSPYLY